MFKAVWLLALALAVPGIGAEVKVGENVVKTLSAPDTSEISAAVISAENLRTKITYFELDAYQRWISLTPRKVNGEQSDCGEKASKIAKEVLETKEVRKKLKRLMVGEIGVRIYDTSINKNSKNNIEILLTRNKDSLSIITYNFVNSAGECICATASDLQYALDSFAGNKDIQHALKTGREKLAKLVKSAEAKAPLLKVLESLDEEDKAGKEDEKSEEE